MKKLVLNTVSEMIEQFNILAAKRKKGTITKEENDLLNTLGDRLDSLEDKGRISERKGGLIDKPLGPGGKKKKKKGKK